MSSRRDFSVASAHVAAGAFAAELNYTFMNNGNRYAYICDCEDVYGTMCVDCKYWFTGTHDEVDEMKRKSRLMLGLQRKGFDHFMRTCMIAADSGFFPRRRGRKHKGHLTTHPFVSTWQFLLNETQNGDETGLREFFGTVRSFVRAFRRQCMPQSKFRYGRALSLTSLSVLDEEAYGFHAYYTEDESWRRRFEAQIPYSERLWTALSKRGE